MLIIKRLHLFTLLETLIAMALTVAILATLTFFYRQVSDLNTKAEILQKNGFKLRYIEGRFSNIFPRAVSESDPKKDFFFFTVSDISGIFANHSPLSLIFTFDNGVDLSKLFSNHVIARIFLDTRGRLCMATWPSNKRWTSGANIPMKLEVLLEEVESLKFWFFIAPDKKWQLENNTGNQTQPPPPPTTTVVTTVNPTPEGGWIHEWSQDYKQLPAIIKIEVVRNKKSEFFTFPLSNCKRQPTYNQ